MRVRARELLQHGLEIRPRVAGASRERVRPRHADARRVRASSFDHLARLLVVAGAALAEEGMPSGGEGAGRNYRWLVLEVRVRFEQAELADVLQEVMEWNIAQVVDVIRN